MTLARRTVLFTSFICALLCPPPAQAAASCAVVPEAIVTLGPPRLGPPFMWDAHYAALDTSAAIAAAAPLPGGTVLAAGTLTGKDEKSHRVVIAELDRHGRALQDKNYPAKDNEMPVAMAATGKNYAVLSTLQSDGKKKRRARVAWYSGTGKFLREIVLKDDSRDYEAADIAALPDGFVVAINAGGRKDKTRRQGMLARFNAKGEKLWQHIYETGVDTAINGLAFTGSGGLITGKRAFGEAGRTAAWVARLDGKGIIMWQRVYPRGAGSSLDKAVVNGAGFVAAGTTVPFDKKEKALWTIAFSADGNILWQRYIRAAGFPLAAAGLLAEGDGRVIAVANAQAAAGGENRDHMRLLTFSPRGDLINDEAYIDGIGAHATSLTRGWTDERIVTASVDSDDRPQDPNPFKANERDASAATKAVLQKGWVFIASPESWHDPCALP